MDKLEFIIQDKQNDDYQFKSVTILDSANSTDDSNTLFIDVLSELLSNFEIKFNFVSKNQANTFGNIIFLLNLETTIC